MARNGKKAEGITVIGVEAESFHRLRVAQVKVIPGQGLVRVTGKNGAGKTSLLRAVRAALGGAGEVLSESVVNEGSEDNTGQVRLQLSNGFTITRRFTEKSPKGVLTVVGPDGGKFGQGKLDEFVGPLSFDPIAFFELDSRRQREILLSIGSDPELPAKLDGLRKERAQKYEQRTPFIAKKRAASAIRQPDGERPEPVDVSGALARMGQLQAVERQRQDTIRANERRREQAQQTARAAIATAAGEATEAEGRLEGAGRRAAAAILEVEHLERQLAEAREEVEKSKAAVVTAQLGMTEAMAALEALPTPESAAAAIPEEALPPDPTEEMEAIKVRIGEADVVRAAIEPWKAWDKAQLESKEASAEETRLTRLMDALEAQEKALIAAAGISVPGLSFAEDGSPLLNDRPLSVASGAERCRLAVAVAMAADPQLRICLLDEEANGLDLEGLQALDTLAKEHGFQVWACRIGLEGRGEIEVVDGVASAQVPAGVES